MQESKEEASCVVGPRRSKIRAYTALANLACRAKAPACFSLAKSPSAGAAYHLFGRLVRNAGLARNA
jgi:hypothetical protein